jgi:ATP-binding cassette subfamily F protein 3
MRSLLGRFLFRGDDVFKQVRDLSGGEKAKLSLLKLMLSGANTLVLDEPTNHLDIESKEIVEEALLEFKGTLIIVSHDRYLLNIIPDRILELTEDGLVEYKGKFDYYLEKTAGKEPSENADTSNSAEEFAESLRSSEAERKAKKQQEAEDRRRSRKAEETESRIHELEAKISDLQDEMMLPEHASDPEWMRASSEELAVMESEVNTLYDEWMELQA